MRLSKIKLAGFKSFVDPTTIQFPTNLMGIVGPNGCGKSNVIDAVRWVMGESSAKHLRGDSMADVIFNGSSARKPVGTASIELIFDNSDGTIGGQYAGYAEISVKRSVSRDGTSLYFLNGARCRRKDITHIFLGTGLGPRSYAIIEQGMISRLIEARPEEMRVYLEEAAGISKYKDRRRETESRIRHTKENLDRLNDLRDEVDKQIKHLERQARTAERYKKLRADERLLAAELLALRLRELEAREADQAAAVNERDTELQAAIARQREVEAEIEKTRQAHVADSDQLHEVQGRYYKIGAEIARLEQAIQHARELRQRQEQDLSQVESGLAELMAHIAKDEAQIRELSDSLDELGPGLEAARAAESASAEALRSAEQGMQSWQQRWEEFTAQAGEANRGAEVERARIEQLERQSARLLDRRERCAGELTHLQSRLGDAETADLEAEESGMAEEVGAAERRLEALQEEIAGLREQERAEAGSLNELRSETQTARGQLASLEALQEAALGRHDGPVIDWLEGRGLSQRPRLAEQLRVADGWERAVETVLGHYLEAVCVDGIDDVARALDGLTHGAVSLLESDLDVGLPVVGHAAPLTGRVEGPSGLAGLLAGVGVVESLPEALAARHGLGPGESVVTRDGIWLGRGWLRINRERDEKAGVIAREQEIRRLREQLVELSSRAEALEARHAASGEALKSRERQRQDLQEEVNRMHRRHGDLRGRLATARSRVEQARAQFEKLELEASEIDNQLEEAEEAVRSSRSRLEDALGKMSVFEAQRLELENQRGVLREALDAARVQALEDQSTARDMAIKVESRRSTRDSASVALHRLQAQLTQFGSRRDSLNAQLESGVAPLKDDQVRLDQLLDQRVGVESELGRARDTVQATENHLRALQEQRQVRERDAEEIRGGLDELRLAAREISVRRQTVAEQFAGTGFDLGQVREAMDEAADVPAWEEKLERLTARIQRLGPINLASIDELQEQTERKQYLDSQFADLSEALDTLEAAIRKIDRETRTRFKETFDRVNDGIKRIFPRLFGGGHAYLELADDDLLSAGVNVMARPPGKRNSTIHLLSGGEKALTAVALVFAIFELNPSPFCMLDEVDAPLDDANVGRFCDIVREMSERVQFIIITHNKTTMEMTRQLAGVTMNEPGVSHLVAVDIDEAVELAAV
jgi:chromosome segregation protein